MDLADFRLAFVPLGTAGNPIGPTFSYWTDLNPGSNQFCAWEKAFYWLRVQAVGTGAELRFWACKEAISGGVTPQDPAILASDKYLEVKSITGTMPDISSDGVLTFSAGCTILVQITPPGDYRGGVGSNWTFSAAPSTFEMFIAGEPTNNPFTPLPNKYHNNVERTHLYIGTISDQLTK